MNLESNTTNEERIAHNAYMCNCLLLMNLKIPGGWKEEICNYLYINGFFSKEEVNNVLGELPVKSSEPLLSLPLKLQEFPGYAFNPDQSSEEFIEYEYKREELDQDFLLISRLFPNAKIFGRYISNYSKIINILEVEGKRYVFVKRRDYSVPFDQLVANAELLPDIFPKTFPIRLENGSVFMSMEYIDGYHPVSREDKLRSLEYLNVLRGYVPYYDISSANIIISSRDGKVYYIDSDMIFEGLKYGTRHIGNEDSYNEAINDFLRFT